MSRECRYARRFSQLRKEECRAFIPFTLLGWPDAKTSLNIIRAMIESGASALELGLAFSDPMSDGPVIQEAACETIAAGFRVDNALELLGQVRALDDQIPIGLLVYYNMVLARGVEAFFRDAAKAGVDGVLIVDLPPEMADEVVTSADEAGIDLIYIISPLTSDNRLAVIGASAGGFLYTVSRLGITGTEERYDQDLKLLLERARSHSDLPLCVGFGISTPEQAQHMFALGADGVITGSRVIQLVRDVGPMKAPNAVTRYVTAMVEAAASSQAGPETLTPAK